MGLGIGCAGDGKSGSGESCGKKLATLHGSSEG
jgi:hypothetical protein